MYHVRKRTVLSARRCTRSKANGAMQLNCTILTFESERWLYYVRKRTVHAEEIATAIVRPCRLHVGVMRNSQPRALRLRSACWVAQRRSLLLRVVRDRCVVVSHGLGASWLCVCGGSGHLLVSTQAEVSTSRRNAVHMLALRVRSSQNGYGCHDH